MYGSHTGTSARIGQARYGNAVYTYRPDFTTADFREGVIDESDEVNVGTYAAAPSVVNGYFAQPTLDRRHLAEASSIFHLLRNIGSSFFISLSIAEIVRTTGSNYSRMTEMITPYNHALTMPNLTGGWTFDSAAGLARVAKEIGRQAAMLGYLNAFTMYTAASALAVVFVLMIRRKRAVVQTA